MTYIPEKLESLWQAIRQNRQQFAKQAREILKDPNLTPLARQKRVRELYRQAVERHDSLVRQWRNELDTYRQSLVRATLKPRSDSERQLYLQTQKLTGQEWDDFVKSALATKDEPTARAVAMAAFVRGDWTTFQKAAEAVPGAGEVLDFEQSFGQLANPDVKFALKTILTRPSLPPEFDR